MAFRLRLRKPVDGELRRLADEELNTALDCLHRDRPATDHVHEARKSIKKVRAIRRLIKADDGGGFGSSAKRLRAVSQTLSRLRDADATLGALTKLKRADRCLLSGPAFARVERRLTASKRAIARDLRHGGSWPHMLRDLRRVRREVRRWHPDHQRFGALEAGIRESLERGRKAMARATRHGEAHDFHEWRKAVKALWYQLRLLERCGPDVQRDIRALERVESCLGDDHDLVVLCGLLATNAKTRRLVDLDRLHAAANRQHQRLRRAAIASARRLYQRSPRSYLRALERAWRAARNVTA